MTGGITGSSVCSSCLVMRACVAVRVQAGLEALRGQLRSKEQELAQAEKVMVFA